MRSRGIVPILVLSILFLTAGVALATPFEFLNSNESVGAIVYVDVSDLVDGLYTYTYKVENVAFNPDSVDDPVPISWFDLPVAVPLPAENPYGWKTGSLPLTDIVFDEPSGVVSFFFLSMFDEESGLVGLLPGQTSPEFFIRSEFGPKEGVATLWDDGTTINASVTSNLAVPGDDGPADTVPEPGTLFLVGSGLFGLGCLRLLRSTRKSNS